VVNALIIIKSIVLCPWSLDPLLETVCLSVHLKVKGEGEFEGEGVPKWHFWPTVDWAPKS
jgi:hypothetical protein